MKLSEYFDTLDAHWNGQVVICALGTNGDEWWRRRSRKGAEDCSFYMNAAMGFASSFGLGVALAVPDREVWVLDSDGGLAMNACGLLTEASAQPGNLKHFVLDNGCYGCLGGNPLVNADRSDYAAMARGAGIANVHAVSDAASCREALQACRGLERHAFIVADIDWSPAERESFERPLELGCEGPELKYRFGRAMERLTGRRVFGPRGC
jgi:sulfopyruvate decarboxylase subunit beta